MNTLLRAFFKRLGLFALFCLTFLPALRAATTDETTAETVAETTADGVTTRTTIVNVNLTDGVWTAGNNNSTNPFYSAWQSTTNPQLTLTVSGNNMATDDTNLALYGDGGKTYTITVAGGQTIKAISFKAKTYGSKTAASVTIGGTSYTATDDGTEVSVTDLSATSQTFTVSGTSAWASLADFTVTLEASFTGTAFKISKTTGSFTGTGTYNNKWISTSTSPGYCLTTTKNNMEFKGDSLKLWTGDSNANDESKTAFTSTYHVYPGKGYQITGYSLTYKYGNATKGSRTVTTNGTTFAADSLTRTITFPVMHSGKITFVIQDNVNAPLYFSDLTVYMATLDALDMSRTELFTYDYTTGCYRIPAIAKTNDGHLIAFSDDRSHNGGSDVGSGRVDILCRTSSDNGATWDEAVNVATGTGVSGQNDCGYGDAAVVADRESNKVLMMCAAGYTSYQSSSATTPIRIARTYSTDNGATWEDMEDVTSDIYGLFKESSNGVLTGAFFGSGRICQSNVVKVGDYYRLYAALCAKPNGNRVLYSDDFGENWKVLGTINDLPAVSGDEPKCEELPDGTVILSSRKSYGRYFNFFTYASENGVKNGEGTWGTVATSSSDNSGTYAESKGTNGEILVLPATRNSDGKEVYVALQSVPLAGSRTNVGIHYKELSSLDDVKDPSTFASSWDGHLQISDMSSAYSTMFMQDNGSIAFVYEEATYGLDYTLVYKPLTLETISGGAYSYKSSVNSKTLVHDVLQERVDAINTDKDLEAGMALGMLTPTSATTNTENSDATKAVNIYDTTPTAQGYADAMAALAEITTISTATYNQPAANTTYVFTNKNYSTYRLTLKETTTTTTTTDETTGTETSTSTTTYSYVGTTDEVDNLQKFQLVATGTEGVWYVYNEEKKQYMGPSPALYGIFAGVSDESSAGTFTITSGTDGYSYLTCTNPTDGSYVNPHLDAQKNIVPWTADNDATYWKIMPVDDAETERAALLASIESARQHILGTSLGTYTDPNASDASNSLSAVLAAACKAAADMSSTSETLTAQKTALDNAISVLTLNQPASGSFIRIRTTSESHATQPYLLPYNSSYNSDRAALGAGTEKETIFYYAGEKLLSYYNGYYLTNTYITTNGSTTSTNSMAKYNGVTEAASVTFPEATTGTKIGNYSLKYASDRYLYANKSGTTYYADAWRSSAGHECCNFKIEEVTSLPVTVGSAEWSTLCAPVALTIPESDDLYVYTGKRSGEYLQLTPLTGTLPANTPVVINAAAGTYYFAIDKTSEAENENNSSLSGTVEAITVEAGAHLTLQYIDEIGFYQFLGTEIPGFKSYISAEVAQNVRGLIFSPTTAIDQVETAQPAMQDKTIYDLQGRRVNKAGKGVYIIGGKKVIRF